MYVTNINNGITDMLTKVEQELKALNGEMADNYQFMSKLRYADARRSLARGELETAADHQHVAARYAKTARMIMGVE